MRGIGGIRCIRWMPASKSNLCASVSQAHRKNQWHGVDDMYCSIVQSPPVEISAVGGYSKVVRSTIYGNASIPNKLVVENEIVPNWVCTGLVDATSVLHFAWQEVILCVQAFIACWKSSMRPSSGHTILLYLLRCVCNFSSHALFFSFWRDFLGKEFLLCSCIGRYLVLRQP